MLVLFKTIVLMYFSVFLCILMCLCFYVFILGTVSLVLNTYSHVLSNGTQIYFFYLLQ